MSWENLSRENAISMAEVWRNDGKSFADIRGLLVMKGLSNAEAEAVLDDLSDIAETDSSSYDSLGKMARESIQTKDTPRMIAFNLWKQGKSMTYIRNHLIERGFSDEEIDDVVRGLGISNKRKKSALNNYGSLGRERWNAGQSGSSISPRVIAGLVIMAIGCSISYGSLQAASNSSTGGTVTIAWGAIIFGAVMLFKGLMNDN